MQKIHKHLLQVLGGYRRGLKRKNFLKGFTLVELIVVIVILAILAAILIPGLLKWIDQAKEKKYELEARGIAQAAEAALTKMYAQGTGVSVSGGKLAVGTETDLMKDSSFSAELEKFTDATVEKIEIYGNSDDSTPEKWGGSVSGFKIGFTSDGVPITAELSPDTGNRWVIDGSSDGTGDEADNDPPEVQEAKAIARAAADALKKMKADGEVVNEIYWGELYTSGHNNLMDSNTYRQELEKLIDMDITRIHNIYLYGNGWNSADYSESMRPWNESIIGFKISFVSSDGVDDIRAFYISGPNINWNGTTKDGGFEHYPSNGLEITKNPRN